MRSVLVQSIVPVRLHQVAVLLLFCLLTSANRLKHPATLADDFSFVEFDGQLYGRQDMLDQFAHGGIDIQPYEMKVVSLGDDVAIVTYNVVFRIPPSEDQGPPPRYQHFSTVWVKQGDAWKMKFQQMTAAHWGDW